MIGDVSKPRGTFVFPFRVSPAQLIRRPISFAETLAVIGPRRAGEIVTPRGKMSANSWIGR